MSQEDHQEIQDLASNSDLHLVFSIGEDPAAPDVHLPTASRLHIPVSSGSPLGRLDFVSRCNANGFRVRALSVIDPHQPELLLDLGSDLAVRDIQEWTISPPSSSADEQWLTSEAGDEPHFIAQVRERFPWMRIEFANVRARENSLIANFEGALFTADPVTARRIFLGWLNEMELSDLQNNALFDLEGHLRHWLRMRPDDLQDQAGQQLSAGHENGNFQAFVSYDNSDWLVVKDLAQQLRDIGVRVWVDKWDLQPGSDWLQAIEEAMDGTSVMLLVIGSMGKIVSPHQLMEPRAFLQEIKSLQCRIIPVILKSAPPKIEIPRIFKSFSFVDFRQTDPDPFQQLIWGITGKKSAS